MAKKQAKPVVVTTEYRGVFFGYVVQDESPAKIVLSNVRNCVHWSSDVKGVLGLAATGPSQRCRIGPLVPEASLWKITSVLACTPEAVKAWESSPWS